MTTINCDFTFKIEHCGHISIEPNQSEQLPWVNFRIFRCFACFYAQELTLLHSFCFLGEEGRQGGWAWHIKDWVDQVGVPYGSRKLSHGFQVLMTVCYLQGWTTRGLDQMVDGLPWDWEPDAHEGTCGQDQDASDFVEGPSLILFEHHLRRRLDAKDSVLPDNDLIELVLR
jgi:hypothetical protein